jgi:hypothetical protein
MQGRRSDIARLHSDFYRDQLRKTLQWLVASVFFMLLIMLVTFYVVLTAPSQRYYANTSEGRILPMPYHQ